MTDLEDFYHKPCEKLSAACVDAFTTLIYDETDEYNLGLSTSWGESFIDMRPIVKGAETVTHLSLTDTSLQYDKENGEIDCISGEALAGIIHMQDLADVNKSVALQVGMAYVWDGKQFTPQTVGGGGGSSALEARVAQLETSVALLQNSNTELTQELTTATQNITDLQRRVTALEEKLTEEGYGPNKDIYSGDCFTESATGQLHTELGDDVWQLFVLPKDEQTSTNAIGTAYNSAHDPNFVEIPLNTDTSTWTKTICPDGSSSENSGGTTPTVWSCYEDPTTNAIWEMIKLPTAENRGIGRLKVAGGETSVEVGKYKSIEYTDFQSWTEVECPA